MLKRLLGLATLVLLLGPAMAQEAKGADKPSVKAPEKVTAKAPEKTDDAAAQTVRDEGVSSALSALEYGSVEGPGVRFYCRVSGTSTAEGLIDVFTPVDGRVGDLTAKLFSWVEKDEVLAVVSAVELAAMLDASSSKAKKTTRNRWKNVYDYHQIKAPEKGVVVGLYVQNKKNIYEQEKVLTIAKSIFVIAKTNEKVYVPLKPGMLARLANKDGVTVPAVLRTFMQIGKTGQYQLRLEITDNAWRVRPGMVFDGDLMLTDNPEAAMVPVESIIHKNGRTYLMTLIEVDTGVRNEWYSEVYNVFPGEIYVEPSSLLKIDNTKYRQALEARRAKADMHRPEITGTQPEKGAKIVRGGVQKPSAALLKIKNASTKATKKSVVSGTHAENEPLEQAGQPTSAAGSIMDGVKLPSAAPRKKAAPVKKPKAKPAAKAKSPGAAAAKPIAEADYQAPPKADAPQSTSVQGAVTIGGAKLPPMPSPTYGDVGGDQGGSSGGDEGDGGDDE